MKATLSVVELVHGGEALARHDGRVIFLRGAAPGDVVEVELTGEGRFEHARTLKVLQRGAARVDAPCPIVERCGGCPVQHVSYEAQLAAKEELTWDALERIGGFPRGSYEAAKIVRSPSEFQYRRRARLHRIGNAWGFSQRGENRIEPVQECLLFEPLLQALTDEVRKHDLPGATDLGLLVGEKHGAVDLRGNVQPKRAEKLLGKLIKGVTLGSQVFGDPVLASPALPNGARLRARPDTFAQANRSAVPLLQAAAQAAIGDAGSVLELFCGSGTLTLPLLGKHEVTAVDTAGPALALLRRSADEAKLPVKLIAGDAAEIAARYTGSPECVLLDPPRTGAAETMKALQTLKPKRVVYVSCDAPTLARDAKLLGYRLLKAQPLDLFPQTAHFEIVATLERP